MDLEPNAILTLLFGNSVCVYVWLPLSQKDTNGLALNISFKKLYNHFHSLHYGLLKIVLVNQIDWQINVYKYDDRH